MTTEGSAPRTRGRPGLAAALVIGAVVIAAAIVIGLNVGGRAGVSAQPTASPPGSAATTTESPSPTATATATATATTTPPQAATLTWELLDGALEDDARVLGVTNISGRWFAAGIVGQAPAIWAGDGDQPRTWTRTTLDTTVDADHYAQVTDIRAVGDNLVAFGSWGILGDQYARISWLSTDGGATWAERRSDDPGLRFVTAGGPGLIGASWNAGGTLPFDSFIERSEDGMTWERFAPAAMRNSQVMAVAVLGDRLVAVGGAFGEGINPAAWYSDDGGRSWAAAEISGADGAVSDVTQLGQGLVAVGGSGVPTAWTTEDGISWQPHQMGEAGSAFAVTPMETGGVVVVGNDGTQSSIGKELSWSSVDGVTWQDAGEMPSASSQVFTAAAHAGAVVVGGGSCQVQGSCPTPLWLGLPAE